MRTMRSKSFIPVFILSLSAFFTSLAAQNLKIAKVGEFNVSTYFSSATIHGRYAYLTDPGNGLVVMDVGDPQNPIIVAELGTPAFDAVVQGSYAYLLGSRSLSGAADHGVLFVVDISDPLRPALQGTCDVSGIPRDLQVLGTRAYVATENVGIQIVDIGIPSAPAVVGAYDPITAEGGHYSAVSLFLAARFLYVAACGGGMDILDVSDPTNPIRIGGYPAVNVSRVLVSGGYAIASVSPGFLIIDVSDPTAPRLISDLRERSENFPAPLYWAPMAGAAKYLFIKSLDYSGTSGNDWSLLIMDISNPAAPTRAGGGPQTEILAISNGMVYANSYAHPNPYQSIIDSFHIGWVGYAPFAIQWKGSYVYPGESRAIRASGTTVYYLDDRVGLTIVDVSDPAMPVRLGTFQTKGIPQAIGLAGPYAYIVDRSGPNAGTLYSLDVSNPSAPVLAGSAEIGGSGRALSIMGNTAYVVYNYGDYESGLKIFDLTNPAHPVLQGELAVDAQDIAVAGSYAYLTGPYFANTLTIVQVTDPRNPIVAGTYAFGPHSYDVKIAAQGSLLYCGFYDRDASLFRVQILDIRNPVAPVLIGESPGYNFGFKRLRVEGRYLYACTSGGIEVFDVSVPASPVWVASYAALNAFDVAISGSSIFVIESFDDFWYYPAKKIHILKMAEGFWPVLSVGRQTFRFGWKPGIGVTSGQTTSITNTGYGTLHWTATASDPWIKVSPGSGTGNGVLSVSVDPSNLIYSTSGIVTISDPNAIDGQKTIQVYLDKKDGTSTGPNLPFGYFETPAGGTQGIKGAAPVTGWALEVLTL